MLGHFSHALPNTFNKDLSAFDCFLKPLKEPRGGSYALNYSNIGPSVGVRDLPDFQELLNLKTAYKIAIITELSAF